MFIQIVTNKYLKFAAVLGFYGIVVGTPVALSVVHAEATTNNFITPTGIPMPTVTVFHGPIEATQQPPQPTQQPQPTPTPSQQPSPTVQPQPTEQPQPTNTPTPSTSPVSPTPQPTSVPSAGSVSNTNTNNNNTSNNNNNNNSNSQQQSVTQNANPVVNITNNNNPNLSNNNQITINNPAPIVTPAVLASTTEVTVAPAATTSQLPSTGAGTDMLFGLFSLIPAGFGLQKFAKK